MDKNRNNSSRTGGRRVTKTTTEYDWESLESRSGLKKSSSARKGTTTLEKRIRHQKRQKQKRLKAQRRRALAVLIAAVILLIILLFLTPIFNIRSVSVEGNALVSSEQFEEKLKPLIGENLFRSGSGKIRKTLKTITYIEDAQVQKRLFPPSVKVTVKEYVPAAVIRSEGKSLLVNDQLRVLTDTGEQPVPVPAVSGFEVSGYENGEILKSDDAEKTSALSTALSTLRATGIIDKTIEVSVNDTSDITINYDNRLTVLCGSSLDLERKLRLFRETLTSNSLAENARGTMDLSESGKAIYTP